MISDASRQGSAAATPPEASKIRVQRGHFGLESGEAPFPYGFSGGADKMQKIGEVVQGVQAKGKKLTSVEKMAQVSA